MAYHRASVFDLYLHTIRIGETAYGRTDRRTYGCMYTDYGWTDRHRGRPKDKAVKLLLSHCKSTMGPKNWFKIGKESIGSPPKYNRSVPRPHPTPAKNFIKNPFITFADIWFTRNDYTHSHTQSTDTHTTSVHNQLCSCRWHDLL